MESRLQGGCLCGAIRFECRAAPITAVFCHCRTCQKFHAAPYAACALMPHDAIAVVSGQPVRYDAVGDSGAVVFREFCGECGTQLFSGSASFPQAKSVKIAALDDPAAVSPVAHVFTESRVPWAPIEDGLPRYARGVEQLAELERLWAERRTGVAPRNGS